MPDDFEYEEKSYEEEDEDNEYPNDPKYYKNMIKDFEKTHFKVLDPPCFTTIFNDRVETYSENEFRVQNKHIKCNVDIFDGRKKDVVMKKKNLVDVWINDYVDIRLYERFNIYPNISMCPDNEYNLWTPFRAELIEEWENKEEGLEILLNHIKILCGNNDQVYNYFLDWLAHMIQFPEKKPGTMLTFISKEGAGKNTLFILFKKLLSDKKVIDTPKPSEYVWGKFNESVMRNGYLICLNEMSKREREGAEGNIKSLITDDSIIIQQKNKPSYVVNSYHRFISFTNNEEPMNTKKDDRRNVIVRCSDELIGNNEYFNRFYEMLEDDSVIKTFYLFLKDRTIGNLNNKPLTQYQEDLQEISVSPIELFFEDYTITKKDTEQTLISSSMLYEKFNNFISKRRIRYEINQIRFGLFLKNLNIPGIEKKRTSKGIFYNIDFLQLREYYDLDSLQDIEFLSDDDDI